MQTNLDQTISGEDGGNLRDLEVLLENVTYAHLSRETMMRLGDAHFGKMFRLSQLSIEYLMYTQNYLELITKSLQTQYDQYRADTERLHA